MMRPSSSQPYSSSFKEAVVGNVTGRPNATRHDDGPMVFDVSSVVVHAIVGHHARSLFSILVGQKNENELGLIVSNPKSELKMNWA